MIWWTLALAVEPVPAPPPPAPVIEIVGQIVEGEVKLVLAGREGDKVFIDEWEAGVLPVQTVLSEGEHVFKVSGPKGPVFTTTLLLKPVKDMLVQVDLAGGPNPPPTPLAPAPAPGAPVPPAAPTISKN